MTTLDKYQNLMLCVSVQYTTLLSITVMINMCCTFQYDIWLLHVLLLPYIPNGDMTV
jgi:hypothetical protein